MNSGSNVYKEECFNCGRWYLSKNKHCPNCGMINLDKDRNEQNFNWAFKSHSPAPSDVSEMTQNDQSGAGDSNVM